MKRERTSYSTRERYQAILQAAIKLFGERGYQAVSIDEIARTAGVAKGLVNYHFGSKEELLEEVLRQGTSALFAQLDAVAQRGDPAKQKIRTAVELYLAIASTGPALTQMAMTATFDATYSEHFRKLWQAFMEENLSRFAELIEQGIARGEFKPVDSRLVTQFVMAMAFEVLRLAMIRQKPLDPHEAADQVTRILFEGIER